jgi:hypothetical protein
MARKVLNGLTVIGLVDAADAGLRTKHEAGATPTGGSSGEVRVGTDTVWFQDAGTWKAIAPASVAALAPATSFATMVKFGTD